MREKKSLVNDPLSPNSLILVRKVTRNEFVFLCFSMFMWDRTFWNIFGTLLNVFGHSLSYYRTPSKNPGTLRIKMSCLLIKKNGVDSIHLHSLVSFKSIYFPVSNTRWQKFSTSKLWSMSPMLRNTMASRNTFSSRTETKILNLYMKVILLSHFCSI